MASGSKAIKTEGTGKTLPTAAKNLLETEVKPVVCPAMGKPSISGLPLHNHNILY